MRGPRPDAGALLLELWRCDPERAPLALFARGSLRPLLAAALLIHAELARACEEASEEMVALVRLAWWREALAGESSHDHPALAVLADEPAALLIRRTLLASLPVRERLVEERGFATLADYRAYAAATSGALHRLLAELAGRGQAVVRAAAEAGTAYGIAGLLRSQRAYARRGIALLPRELIPPRRVLARAGGVAVAELPAAVRRLLAEVDPLLPPRPPRDPLVRLPLALARRSRRQLARAGFDPFHPRIGPLPWAGIRPSLLLWGIRPRA